MINYDVPAIVSFEIFPQAVQAEYCLQHFTLDEYDEGCKQIGRSFEELGKLINAMSTKNQIELNRYSAEAFSRLGIESELGLELLAEAYTAEAESTLRMMTSDVNDRIISLCRHLSEPNG